MTGPDVADLVVCVGGPRDGQWFHAADCAQLRAAAGRTGVGVSLAYQSTGRVVAHSQPGRWPVGVVWEWTA